MRFLRRVQAKSEQFLPTDLVMLDCEMTGVVPKRDQLLQVAALKLRLDDRRYRVVGEPLNEFLAYRGQPSNDFHRKYLVHVFQRCNASNLTPQQLKVKLHAWLGPLRGKVQPVGDCVPTDVAFLLEKGCADGNDIGDSGPIPGTFSYEFFDLNAVKAIARAKAGSKFDKQLPLDPGVHDALVDCQNQLLELNAFLDRLLADVHP